LLFKNTYTKLVGIFDTTKDIVVLKLRSRRGGSGSIVLVAAPAPGFIVLEEAPVTSSSGRLWLPAPTKRNNVSF